MSWLTKWAHWLPLIALALLVSLSDAAFGQAHPFGINNPAQRTRDTAAAMHADRVGRQRAVSAAIVHDTPEKLDLIYANMYFNNRARLGTTQDAGIPTLGPSLSERIYLDNLAYQAMLARSTQDYVTRSRGGYMNPGGLSGLPGGNLLMPSPQEWRRMAERGELGPSRPLVGSGVLTINSAASVLSPGPVPDGNFGYGFAPNYGPR